MANARFDAATDGYSRGEGCGMFVLKRLSAAVAENDNILGVIGGVEVNKGSWDVNQAPVHHSRIFRLIKTSVQILYEWQAIR
jgi:3-oxoacyl-(acyl-carrier-protein) synthase